MLMQYKTKAIAKKYKFLKLLLEQILLINLM